MLVGNDRREELVRGTMDAPLRKHIDHLAKRADKIDAGITRRMNNPQPRTRKQRHLRAVA